VAAGARAAESAASLARDGAADARSEYYTAEEMAEFAKPKKKKARAGPRMPGRLQPCMQGRPRRPPAILSRAALASHARGRGTACRCQSSILALSG